MYFQNFLNASGMTGNVKKWLKSKILSCVCEEFEDEKKRGQTFFDLPEQGFEP